MEKVGITEFRKNLYQLADAVLKSGEPLEISRNGKSLLLSPVKKTSSKLSRLRPHKAIIGNPDDLVDIKVYEWKDTDYHQ
jgi:antitoxin (DNA-binding transcriptional repressor) of toxin-antitoxin stability system